MSTAAPILVRLIYASRMTRTCQPKDIEAILAVSRKNNKRMGVTGALCYSPRGFLQCLEGPRESVNELYRRIVQDTRNVGVTLISYGPIRRRRFADWTMAYMRADEVDRAILARHGLRGRFDPCVIDDEQALGLLYDIARERAAFLASQKAD